MDFFQRIVRAIRGRLVPKPADKGFQLDVDTARSLRMIAQREQRPLDEIANQILDDVLRGHEAQETNWLRWQSLTPREQEITALVCMNYTSRQIGSMLNISGETVKSHMEHVLLKFEVPDRHALRRVLSSWDFSAWVR